LAPAGQPATGMRPALGPLDTAPPSASVPRSLTPPLVPRSIARRPAQVPVPLKAAAAQGQRPA
jgi:hypothetical protein